MKTALIIVWLVAGLLIYLYVSGIFEQLFAAEKKAEPSTSEHRVVVDPECAPTLPVLHVDGHSQQWHKLYEMYTANIKSIGQLLDQQKVPLRIMHEANFNENMADRREKMNVAQQDFWTRQAEIEHLQRMGDEFERLMDEESKRYLDEQDKLTNGKQ